MEVAEQLLAKGPQTEFMQALEALGSCLGAVAPIFKIQHPEEVASWLCASSDAVAHGSGILLLRAAGGAATPAACVGAPQAGGAASLPGAGPLLRQLAPVILSLLQHRSAGVAAAGLRALACFLRHADASEIQGLTTHTARAECAAQAAVAAEQAPGQQLMQATVEQLMSQEANVRDAALFALPWMLRLWSADGQNWKHPAGGHAPSIGNRDLGDQVAASEDAFAGPEVEGRMHPQVQRLVGALSEARVRAVEAAAVLAATQPECAEQAAAAAADAAAALQAQRVALLRGAAAVGGALAGDGAEAPLMVVLADHLADDDAQVGWCLASRRLR